MTPWLRAVVGAFWIGVIVALSFIETPLKFQAPGVTLPIALGIGRLVFTAANIAGTVLLVALTALSWARPRVTRAAWIVLGGLWLVLLLQIAVIRPLLGARTDAILAGGDPGSSPLHVLYVVADLLLLGLLVAYLWIVRPARAGGPRS